MNDHRHVPLFLALLVLLSGCSLLGDGGVDGTPTPMPNATPKTTPAPATATPTPSATPTPTPSPRSVELTVRGTEATPHTLIFRFVEDPVEQVRVQYADGSERTVAIENDTLPNGTLDGAVDLLPVADVEREVRHTDDTPTDGVTLGVPTTASDLFFVVVSEDRVVGWRHYTCGPGDVTGLNATVTADGIRTENLACET